MHRSSVEELCPDAGHRWQCSETAFPQAHCVCLRGSLPALATATADGSTVKGAAPQDGVSDDGPADCSVGYGRAKVGPAQPGPRASAWDVGRAYMMLICSRTLGPLLSFTCWILPCPKSALASLTVPYWLYIISMAAQHGAWTGQGTVGSSVSCCTSPGTKDACCMLLLMAMALGDLQHLPRGRSQIAAMKAVIASSASTYGDGCAPMHLQISCL